jgi:hypothetical protein
MPNPNKREFHNKQGCMVLEAMHRIPVVWKIDKIHRPLLILQTLEPDEPLPKCDYCHKQYPSDPHKNLHMSTCSLLYCNDCDGKCPAPFNNPWELKLHQFIHFKCPVPECNKDRKDFRGYAGGDNATAFIEHVTKHVMEFTGLTEEPTNDRSLGSLLNIPINDMAFKPELLSELARTPGNQPILKNLLSPALADGQAPQWPRSSVQMRMKPKVAEPHNQCLRDEKEKVTLGLGKQRFDGEGGGLQHEDGLGC